MTLSKKGSRPITVDGVPLRHVVSVSRVGEGGFFPLNMTVQLATGHGRVLRVHGLLTRDRWLDFPEREHPDCYPTLKPADVAAVVRLARASGWDPQEIGTPFLLEIDADTLRTRTAVAE